MGKNLTIVEQTFFFCDGGSCKKAGGESIIRQARAYLMNKGLWKKTHTIKTRCNGRCEDAPTCIVDGKYWYQKLTPDKIIPVMESHIYHNKPVIDDLLYQNGWNEISSEKNLLLGQAKTFELINDSELGSCYIARGFSSDQYLFPLFSFLFQEKQGSFLYSDSSSIYDFQDGKEVTYENSNTMRLSFNNRELIDLIIGSVTKETTQKDIISKITKTEYYIQSSTGKKGIRFKNKFGGIIGKIPLEMSNHTIWKYCLEIQLSNAIEPKEYKINV